MYIIESFDNVTGELTFKIIDQNRENGNPNTVILNVKKDKRPNFSDYRNVPNKAYLQEDTTDIVLIDFPTTRLIPPPLIHQDIDGKPVKFIRATQYEYDRWSNREFPESDNAKVFKLIDNLISQ